MPAAHTHTQTYILFIYSKRHSSFHSQFQLAEKEHSFLLLYIEYGDGESAAFSSQHAISIARTSAHK